MQSSSSILDCDLIRIQNEQKDIKQESLKRKVTAEMQVDTQDLEVKNKVQVYDAATLTEDNVLRDRVAFCLRNQQDTDKLAPFTMLASDAGLLTKIKVEETEEFNIENEIERRKDIVVPIPATIYKDVLPQFYSPSKKGDLIVNQGDGLTLQITRMIYVDVIRLRNEAEELFGPATRAYLAVFFANETWVNPVIEAFKWGTAGNYGIRIKFNNCLELTWFYNQYKNLFSNSKSACEIKPVFSCYAIFKPFMGLLNKIRNI